ncbi:Gfo/Idh/MocA family protein [Frigoriglobus tundricola]|uniref:Glucose--fructose oxidoreductase n=1 Tax=Frigoriglobus tundricola TaxID=2774151 RepID=A0A6M5YGE6_9BACT|nr:Gfo/Idh/MocA family oxidoreductase [Frigoriglobus tundricola]QJW93075.1 Glucose--fructose oxidoreductase [Frigoriglobus tundricola]
MALDLTPEQKATGKTNFEQASGDLARAGKMNTLATGGTDPKHPDRRDVLKAGLAAGAVVPVSAAVYFGYESWKGNKAVKTALIGCGDEGGVLIGDHNPEYNEIVAVCDIRPSNIKRIFDGDTGPRKGLKKVYGEATAKKIAKYDSLSALLADKSKLGLEAVVIATPLNTHDVIAKTCMDAGLHVLCEKLMARDVTRCKGMIQYAKEKGALLSIGHQRHYSTLYAQSLELIENGILGDIKHIRALWHRNNSWPYDPRAFNKEKYAEEYGIPYYVDSWWKEVPREDAAALPPAKLAELAFGDPSKYGFKDVAELVRWRCSEKTGGGLMAELGSHQLDASSIILGHVHPLSVQGVGGKFFYGPGRNDRESDDGVFVTFEFPGPKHPKAHKGGKDENDVVVVTFTSFNSNEFEGYGEWVMGSQGTMFLEKESDVYLWREKDKSKKGDSGGRETKITVSGAGGGKPVMESASTWGGGGATGAPTKTATGGMAWDSAVRGYRTEMEHFAYCLREWQKRGGKVSYEKDTATGKLKHADIIPRCHGEVAMADAIIALTANMAMASRKRIEFEDAWFDADKPDAPETKYGTKKA